MSSTPRAVWLELSKADFLSAIRRLQPGRMAKSFLAREVQIGLVAGEAVFCVEGAQTRRPATGCWNGFVCLSYGVLFPFLKIKPDGDMVRLAYEDGRIKIGPSRMQARWIEVSPWISTMALEAHFMGPPEGLDRRMFCPACGKRLGVELASLAQLPRPSAKEERLLAAYDLSAATHGCTDCGHVWTELGSRA